MSARIVHVKRLALVSILLASPLSAVAQEESDAPDEGPDLEAPAELGAAPRPVDLPTPELDGEPARVTAPETFVDPDPQGQERDFGDVESFLESAVAREEWVLDDGVTADEVPWNDYDPVSDYTPDGLLHAGLQLRIAWLPGGPEPLPDGPMLELGLFGDVRYGEDTAWHLRGAIAIAYQPYSDEYLGGGLSRTTSPFAVKFRLQPVAFDIGNYVSLRAGGEVGFQWVPRAGSDGELEAFGGATAEGVIRLLEGYLEVGVVAGFQLTAYGELSRLNGYRTQLGPEGLLGLTAAYLIQ